MFGIFVRGLALAPKAPEKRQIFFYFGALALAPDPELGTAAGARQAKAWAPNP